MNDKDNIDRPTKEFCFSFDEMKVIEVSMVILMITAGTGLVLGLYRPSLLLWWSAIQNRKKVIYVYGTILLISFFVYLLI